MTAPIFPLMGLAMIVAVRGARGAVNGFALCGPVECADDPAGYWIAKYLP